MKKSSWLLIAMLALTGSSSWGMPSWWPFSKAQSGAANETSAVVASGQFKYQNANKDWVTLNPGDKAPTGVALVAVSAQASVSEFDVTIRTGGGDVIQIDPSNAGLPALKVTAVNSVSGSITVATKDGAVATVPSGGAVIASNSATPFTVVSGVVAVTVNGKTANYSAGQTASTAPQQIAVAAAPTTTIATTSPTQEVTAQPVSPSHP